MIPRPTPSIGVIPITAKDRGGIGGMHNNRFRQSEDEWMVVEPYPMWGDHFRSTIGWQEEDEIEGE